MVDKLSNHQKLWMATHMTGGSRNGNTSVSNSGAADYTRSAARWHGFCPPGYPHGRDFYGPAVTILLNSSGGTGPLRERLWPAFDVHNQYILITGHQRVLRVLRP
jgi:hypothetical protein